MATIITTTEQIETIVEAAIARHESKMATTTLPPTGHDLWNRFDAECCGNTEFTMWQMINLHAVMARIADHRAGVCTDHTEKMLWKAFQAFYAGQEEDGEAFFKAAYCAPTEEE